ncbi:MAG: efflux RND transporter periplasmic adaptor subunit [Opitutales bacterium]|nr:efflux RND transporter periplasmic adaptor subunit [Opitutales bacterium]
MRRLSILPSFSSFFLALFASTSLLSANLPVVEGLVQPYREVIVSSPVQAVIIELPVREGDTVVAGDLLLRLYDQPEVLEKKRTEAALEKREFENRGAQNLFAERLISEDEALARRIELDLSRLQFELAAEQVERRRILSPLGGIVVERHLEEGEMATVGQELFRVVDLSRVYVQLFMTLPESRAFPVDQAVEVFFPETGVLEPLHGEVVFIDPRVDPASGLLRVRVLVDNEDGLAKPGIRAQVRQKGAEQ